jgi:hypothetical protein
MGWLNPNSGSVSMMMNATEWLNHQEAMKIRGFCEDFMKLLGDFSTPLTDFSARISGF